MLLRMRLSARFDARLAYYPDILPELSNAFVAQTEP